MRHLGGAGQRHAAGRSIVSGVAGARLHGRRVLPARAHVDLDDFRRAVPGHVEIGRFEFAFQDDIAGGDRMNLRRAGSERVTRVDHRRGLVDCHLNQIGDVFGLFLARRDDCRDRLADKAHLAVGQDRLADRLVIELVQHRQDRLHALEIGGGDDRRVRRRFDVLNLSSGERAAHEAHPVDGGEIGGEAALAGDQRGIFDAPDGAADPFEPGAFGVRGHVTEDSSARRTTARTRSRR